MRSPPIDKAARYLKGVRDDSGLTLSAIARRAGMDPSTLTQPIKQFDAAAKAAAERKPGAPAVNIPKPRQISLATLRRVAAAMDAPLPPDIDPEPAKKPETDLELAILLAERIPAGRAISSAEKAALIHEILALLRKR